MTSLDTNQGGDLLPFQMPSPGDPMAAQRMRQSVPQIDAEDDAVFARMDAAREQQMLNTFRLAVKKDATLRAEAVRIAGEIGQTPDLVEKNIEVMREWAKRRKVAEMNMTRSNPVLAGKLMDLEFARITHDDVANLGFVENITKQLQAGAVGQQVGELEWKKAQKTATAQEEAQLEDLRTAQEGLPMTSGGFFGGAARSLGQLGAVAPAAAKRGAEIAMASATVTAIATATPGVTLPAAVATVPASLVTGFFIGVTSELFMQWQHSMSGDAFRQMRDDGYDEDAAYYASFGVGVIGASLESASMGTATSFLVKPLVKRLISDTIAKRLTKEGVSEAFTQLTTRSALKTGLTRYAQTLGAEGLTEASQTVVEHLGRKIAKQYSPEVLLREFADPSKADDLSDSLASMFEETLYQAGLLSAVGPGLALRVDLAKAKRADAAFQTLGNLVKAVDATATKKRNPDVAADTVQDMADASGAGTFYVAPDKLGEVLNAMGETPESADKVLPGLAAKLNAALQSGGLVEIPAGDFVARTARTGFQEAILPHIKTAVDAMSQFEAKEVISQFQQNIAAHGEMAMQDKDFAASAARVGKSIYEQVKGSGVFDADDKVRGATLAAKTWFQNFAARVNQSPEEAQALFGKTRITPEDVYAKFPLKIGVGEMQVTGADLNAIGGSSSNIQPLFDLSYVSEGNAIRTVKVGDTTIVLDARPGSIKVSSVRTTKAKRGTGSARAAMSALVAQADAQNVTLTLDASPLDNATNRSSLVKFYESLGFEATGEVINPAGDPQMSRSPSTLKAGSTAQYSVGEHKITLTKAAKLPEFMHELSHFWTDVTLALAQDPNAPAFAKQDAQTLLDFFGLKSMDEWNALSKPERVKRYEQIAYNAPIYWAEGKAPTKGLAKLFNNMRRWILDVYKDIRGSMNEQYRKELANQGLPQEDLPILTPEIRRWFDNMLASERMIEEAYAARKLQPLFETKPEGMSDAQWSELQEVSQSQFEKAVNTLDQHSLATVGYYKRKADELRSKIDRQKQEVRKAMREEVAKEIRGRAIYQVINYLLTGKILYTDGSQKESTRLKGKGVTKSFKMDTDAVREILGNDEKAMEAMAGMTVKGGLNPNEVAESFGFKEGAAKMIRQIIASPSIEEKIEEVTDRRIEAEFGELSDPQKVEETIASAIHNDLRADMIAMEFRALSKMMMPLGVLRDAARIAAITILNGMNVGDIDVRKFDAAAVRARRMAEKAMGKPNGTFEALQYKRQELLQTELARLATQEKKEIEKRIASIKKMGKVGDKDLGKGRHYETALAARALAGLYEIAGSAKFVDAKAKIDNIKTYDEEMHRELAEILAVAANVVEEARARRNVIGGKLTRSQKQVYKSITLDEFKNATDAIEAIWQEASDMKKVEIDGKQMLVDEAAPLLEQKLVDRGAPEVADNVNARRTEARKRMGMFMGHRAHVTRLENLFLYLDGGTPGPWTKMVWRPLNDASVAYRKQWTEFNAEFNAIFKAIRDTGQKDIDAPRLKYKFTDKWELLHAILYSGSVTGKDKLLRAGTSDRTPWGAVRDDGTLDDSAWQETINELVLNGTLTAADFKAVEKLFALFAKLQKPYFQAWRKVFGHPPEAIEHLDIVTPIGTFKGGYIPLRADPERNVDAKFRDLNQETLKTHRVALARVKSGAGKKRTGAVYPLLMDLRKIPSVLGEQIRFINIQPKLGEVMKLLKHQKVMGALERYDETLFTDAIDKWLQRIAFQSTSAPSSHPGIDRWARHIKQSVGLTRMVGNYGNIIGQSTGLAVAVPEVGADRMAKALHHVMTNFGEVFGKIAEADEGMRQRFENQMFDISADTRAVFEDPNWLTKLQDLAATKGYKPQAFVQNIIDATVWMAAYDKAMSDPAVAAMSEEDADAEAVARAGSTVRRTQGALNPESISAYEAGTALHQWFTQFQNYFVMLLNNGYWKGKGDIEQYGWKVGGAKAAYMYLWSMMIPFAVGTAIIGAVKGTLFDDDDEDGYSDIWYNALMSVATGTLGTVPYAGPLMVGVVNRMNDKPYDDRIGSAPSIFAMERFAAFAANTITGKTFTDPSGKTISDAATFFSIWFKIPLDFVSKPFVYWTEVATDRVEPTGFGDALRGTITGAASKDSKK